MMPLTPVVRNLLIINVIMFVASMAMPQLTNYLALFPPMSENFRPYQLVTHFFMHGGLLHIAFNMLALSSIGSMLEAFWRSERFLFYYLFCAIGAGLLQCAVNYYQFQGALASSDLPREILRESFAPAVGASGAIYGLIVATAYYFPEAKFQIFPIPIPISAKYLVPLMIVFELYLGYKQYASDNIAHYAHLGGALFGAILLFYWRKKGL
jgi:membrane associated rhomboid family serine protease